MAGKHSSAAALVGVRAHKVEGNDGFSYERTKA